MSFVKEGDSVQNQRSLAWHEYRKNHVNASEVPVIMGESEFMTIQELWLEKTQEGIIPREPNFAMQRGIEAEPIIEELYERLTGYKIKSLVRECPTLPILSASLDGWVEEKRIVVEFKYPSAMKHQLAIWGRVPMGYISQVQAQLMVMEADVAHYVSFSGVDIAVVEVKADHGRWEEIRKKVWWFWDLVKSRVRP